MAPLDLTTQSFGAWHVLGRGVTTREMAFWVCRCGCGTIAAIHEGTLLEGRAQSCGCLSGRARLYDLTGQRFGQWLVLEEADSNQRGSARWLCQCRCQATRVIVGSDLKRVSSQQCRHCASRSQPLAQRWYGALFVQGFAGIDDKGHATYNCQCRCGVEVVVRGNGLRNGNNTSCGCRGKRVILHQTFGALYVIADAGVLHTRQHWQCVCLHCQCLCVVSARDLHPQRLGCAACAHQRRVGAYLYHVHADIQRWFLSGMSIAEIAKRCQSPRHTVSAYIRRHLANPLDAVGAALQASGEELVLEQDG